MFFNLASVSDITTAVTEPALVDLWVIQRLVHIAIPSCQFNDVSSTLSFLMVRPRSSWLLNSAKTSIYNTAFSNPFHV